MMEQVFEMLAEENPQVTFVKVDVDVNNETSVKYGIQTIPTFKIFLGGEEYDTYTGGNEQALRKMVNEQALHGLERVWRDEQQLQQSPVSAAALKRAL